MISKKACELARDDLCDRLKYIFSDKVAKLCDLQIELRQWPVGMGRCWLNMTRGLICVNTNPAHAANVNDVRWIMAKHCCPMPRTPEFKRLCRLLGIVNQAPWSRKTQKERAIAQLQDLRRQVTRLESL